MDFSITVTDTHVRVRSPYNTTFVPRAKALGGKWSDPEWIFDRRDEERVRKLCQDIYGMDGTTADLCTIRVTYAPGESVTGGPLTIRGRIVARAWGRDTGAKLGEGVVLLSGSFFSGGSMKNWCTKAGNRDGAVVLVRDFPRAVALEMAERAPEEVQIEPEAPIVDRAALEAERARLNTRLAEIDALLATPAPEPVA